MNTIPNERQRHIRLTSHRTIGGPIPRHVQWGAADPKIRGPVIGSVRRPLERNVIGSYGGAYAVYRALAITSGTLSPQHAPDLSNTAPVHRFGPHPQWGEPDKIVSLDPFGHIVTEVFAEEIASGFDIRPTIAITRAHLSISEIGQAVAAGRLKIDGSILRANGDVAVTKAAIDPVWHLPGIARRLGTPESEFRRVLFEQTGGMFPELVTRPDIEVFLPPIGGITLYIFGDPQSLGDPSRQLACRVHDECNGSDVFGSDICTCRPYLTHGIEVCIETAQQGGVGLVVYTRKEGRALGEVTKFLVYNARKRHEGGDTAANYFQRTECVAGVQDARFQELMPDVFHWLGIRRIDRFVSMSDMKHDSLARQGIEVGERVPIPDELVPADAHVEIEAKIAAGYYSARTAEADTTGRGLNE
jgi:GTP cyclohydrolase II